MRGFVKKIEWYHCSYGSYVLHGRNGLLVLNSDMADMTDMADSAENTEDTEKTDILKSALFIGEKWPILDITNFVNYQHVKDSEWFRTL